MLLNKENLKQFVMEITLTIMGAFISAIGIALFLLPNQLSTGGFSGLATIIYYFFKIPMGISILSLNIPLFIVAKFKIGKKFLVKAIVGTTALSLFIDFLDKFEPLTQDQFLACIYGGIVMGLGTSIILRANASTGGSDLLSLIIKKFKEQVRTSNIIKVIDIIIVVLNVIFFKEIEIGMYSAIAIYLMGVIIDVFFEGIYFTKLLIIISNKNEEIAKIIEKDIMRGVTGLYGKGMYKNEDKLILICAASRGDIAKIKQVAKNLDQNSFVIVANAREVVGLGF